MRLWKVTLKAPEPAVLHALESKALLCVYVLCVRGVRYLCLCDVDEMIFIVPS